MSLRFFLLFALATSIFFLAPALLAQETPSLVVTIATDTVDPTDNETSLREAIAHAATLTDPQTITFSDGTGGTLDFFDGTARTITLGGSQLTIDSDVTIAGPG